MPTPKPAPPIPLSEVLKNGYRYGPKHADAHSRDGSLYGNDPDGYDVRVTDPEQPRAAKIIRAVLAALAAQGFRVGVLEHQRRKCTGAEKDGVLVQLVVRETTRRQAVVDSWGKRYVYVPTGRLTCHASTSRVFTDAVAWDRVRRRLEDQIDQIVAACVRIHADAVEQGRKADEWRKQHDLAEAERARREAEQREAEARQDELLRMARAWQDSNLLRAFADEVERVLQGNLSDGGRTWLETARREAEAMDPLRGLRLVRSPTVSAVET